MDPNAAIASEVDAFVGEVWSEVEAYLGETGTAPTMFSKAAVNDPNLLRHIRMGRRRLTFNMALRLKKYLDAQRRAEGAG